jgi:hypothetical protein
MTLSACPGSRNVSLPAALAIVSGSWQLRKVRLATEASFDAEMAPIGALANQCVSRPRAHSRIMGLFEHPSGAQPFALLER